MDRVDLEHLAAALGAEDVSIRSDHYLRCFALGSLDEEERGDAAYFDAYMAELVRLDAEEPADYFRNVHGQNMPFSGNPGGGVPVGGNPKLREALGKHPATQAAVKAKEAAAKSAKPAKPKKLTPKQAAAEKAKYEKEIGDKLTEKQGSLSEKQMDSLGTYSGRSYSEMNASMRNGTTPDPISLKADIRNMDAAFKTDAAVLSESVEIYRGMGGNNAVANAIRTGDLGEGGVIQDKAFVSTSLDPFVARGFAGGEGSVVMKITAPAGSRGIYMGADPPKNLSGFPVEREMLLPRDSKFRITRIEPTKDRLYLARGVKHIVHCEVVQ